jgi:curved DNA-binding protein CbpA
MIPSIPSPDSRTANMADGRETTGLPIGDVYEILQVHPRAHQQVIQAAYRVLAALYHPDRDPSGHDAQRMAQLNAAYAQVRTSDLRAVYDRGRQFQAQVVRPSAPASGLSRTMSDRSASPSSATLEFGRYSGWTIAQIAVTDPDYLRWLSRHSSGIRFRAEIDAVLRRTEFSTPEKPRRR